MNITVKELGEPIELEDYLEEYKFQVIFLLKNMTLPVVLVNFFLEENV